MKMLTKVLEYLKTPSGQRNALVVALVLVIIFMRGCDGDGTSSQDVTMYKQNIEALKDSIRTYESKNGELVHEKMALLTESKDLKKYNEELAAEMKDLKDNPIVITKFKTKIVHDTVFIKPEIDTDNITFNKDSTVKVVPFKWADSTFHDKDNYRKIGGMYLVMVDTGMNVSSKDFAITRDEIGLSFTTGITENKDGLLEIFIKSPYPGFVPTSIDGALIDPRESDVIKKFFPPKRWSLGPYVGYGFYMDPMKSQYGHGLGLGISVQYGLFQWGKK